MNLLSKDAPLEQTLKNLKSIIEKLDIKLDISEQKHPLDNCYSVNIKTSCAPSYIFSNGKGATADASLASGLGEYIERLQSKNSFIDFYLPNRDFFKDVKLFDFDGEYLNSELREFYDPYGELVIDDLIDFNSDYSDKIVTLPFREMRSDEIVYFPLGIISNLYVSNGLAAGNTATEAQVQALSEIVERYVKFEVIKNGYALPYYSDEQIKEFKNVHSDIEKLRSYGYEVLVLDASLGGKFPVVSMALINPRNATLFLSFGAHPILEVALERTLTEMMQGRNIDELDGFEHPSLDSEFTSDSQNLESHFIDSNGIVPLQCIANKKSFSFSSYKYSGNGSSDELSYMLEVLKEYKIYIREYEKVGFYTTQIIIAGLSEIYPVSDLIYNNKNIAKKYRQMLLNYTQYEKDFLLDEFDNLDETLVLDRFIGIIFQESCNVAEFRALLHLQDGDFDSAIEQLEYSKKSIAKLIVEILSFDESEEYYDELCLIYTKGLVDRAIEIVEGREPFIDFSYSSEYNNILELFDRIDV